MEYFIFVNGQNQGPYPVEKLKEMGITPDTMVWTQGMEQWAAAKTIAELQPLFSPVGQKGQYTEGEKPQGQRQAAPGGPQAFQGHQPSQDFQPYQGQQGGGAGFKEFFTDEYENDADVPFVKQWLNRLMAVIDSGSFFREPMRWLYVVIGILMSLGCLIGIWQLIDTGVFKYQALYAILATLVMLAVSVFAVLFWINRSKHLKDKVQVNDDIVAIPVVAHFTQSIGECVGIIMCTVVALMAFLVPLLAGDMGGYMFRELIPIDVSGPLLTAIFGALFCVIWGYLIILVAHFWAETMRAIASIANNTRRIAGKK